MRSETATTEKICPTEKLTVYLDGELAPDEQLSLETHLANCPECLDELNFHKKIFGALDFNRLEETEIELPKNFAKIVATRAESGVLGMRSSRERKRAVAVIAILFAAVLGLALVSGAGFTDFGKPGEQILAFFSFAGNFIYHLALGAAIILRALTGEILTNQKALFAVTGCLLAALCYGLARSAFKQNRF